MQEYMDEKHATSLREVPAAVCFAFLWDSFICIQSELVLVMMNSLMEENQRPATYVSQIEELRSCLAKIRFRTKKTYVEQLTELCATFHVFSHFSLFSANCSDQTFSAYSPYSEFKPEDKERFQILLDQIRGSLRNDL